MTVVEILRRLEGKSIIQIGKSLSHWLTRTETAKGKARVIQWQICRWETWLWPCWMDRWQICWKHLGLLQKPFSGRRWYRGKSERETAFCWLWHIPTDILERTDISVVKLGAFERRLWVWCFVTMEDVQVLRKTQPQRSLHITGARSYFHSKRRIRDGRIAFWGDEIVSWKAEKWNCLSAFSLRSWRSFLENTSFGLSGKAPKLWGVLRMSRCPVPIPWCLIYRSRAYWSILCQSGCLHPWNGD